MSAYDFIISMAVGSILAKVLLSPNLALSESLMAMTVLILLQHAASWLSFRWPMLRRWLEASPLVLFHANQYHYRAMRRERVTEAEMKASAYEKGLRGWAEVDTIIPGSNGQLAVIPKQQASFAQCDEPEFR